MRTGNKVIDCCWKAFIRILSRKQSAGTISKNTPNYLIHDVGLRDVRPLHRPFIGHRLPNWQ